MKRRLDILLVEKGLCKTRSKALDLIKRGEVVVNNKPITKASTEVSDSADIIITNPLNYVSRGGLKLEHALTYWKIDVRQKIAIDIGSSTGGFTDCLLQHEIIKVYAVDVGTNQLHETLRVHPLIEVFEQTDIRSFSLPQKVDIVVIDVSFISLTKLFSTIKNLLKKEGKVIALVKPQFEVGKEWINRQGIVKSEEATVTACEHVMSEAQKEGFIVHGLIESPITGGSGNKEFLLYATL